MDAPRNAWSARRRTLLLRAAALVVTCLACLTTATGASATQSAVATATASPPAFVPDWDGHSDSTVLSYVLQARSVVIIRVVDPRGRVVTSMRIGVREPGTHHATWDGRDARGKVQPPGTYGIRVDARPVPPTPGEPDTAAMGGTLAVAGARAATVTLQRSDVVLTGVELTRPTIGATGSSSRTGARFQLNAAATVAAAIVDGNGRVVRTLATGRMHAGLNSLGWNGRRADGTPAADGEYSLIVAATSGGRPTDTMRVPLNVDRVTPTMRATRKAKASVDASARVRIPITVTTDEKASVEVRLGRRTYRIPVEAGTHNLVLDGARLGLQPSNKARTVSVLVRVVDGAGNASASRTTVVIPKRSQPSRPAPPTPDPTPPTPTPPAPGGQSPLPGTWPWPVGGVVTSEFGLRDGRPHTGIDISVPSGTPIHPATDGTVSFVGQLGGYGNLVIVDHADGVRTYYAHMSRFGGFAVGATVSRLDTIGLVGCTGNCTGPHLHFETRTADTPRNPRSFLTAQ